MTTLSMSKIRAVVVVAAFAIASVSQALHAQGPTKLGTVTVPFAFQAGTAHFVPGAYSISTPTDDLLLIRGASKSAVAMTMRNVGGERSTVSQLVFSRLKLRELSGLARYQMLCTDRKSTRLNSSHL